MTNVKQLALYAQYNMIQTSPVGQWYANVPLMK